MVAAIKSRHMRSCETMNISYEHTFLLHIDDYNNYYGDSFDVVIIVLIMTVSNYSTIVG